MNDSRAPMVVPEGDKVTAQRSDVGLVFARQSRQNFFARDEGVGLDEDTLPSCVVETTSFAFG